MPKSTLHPFRYRTGKKIRTFYAPNRATADEYARRWAKRQGYSNVMRLKPKGGDG